jgi:translocation and assembly module TamA
MHRLNRWLVLMLSAAAALALCAQPHFAAAQSRANAPVKGQETAVKSPFKYDVQTRVAGGDRSISATIKAHSVLVQHEKKGVPDRASLLVRARTDEKQLVVALYGEARYGATVKISIAGKPLDDVDITPASENAGQPIPVSIAVTPGPKFQFGNVVVDQTKPTVVKPTIGAGDVGLVSGQAARSPIIVAAMRKIVEQWRAAGYPFARISEKNVAADHARERVDVKIIIDPGAPAVYGWINVVGSKKLSNRTVVAQSALWSGKRYHPQDLVNTRARLRKLESIESVRIIEGKQIDSHNGIPITLEVKERKPR